MSDPKVIVALDFDNDADALALVDRLSPALCRLKIGKGMFTRFGPDFVKRFVNQGYDVFLDLKFHDIPNTVAMACRAAADLGVWMLNVHASGGLKMLQAARNAVDQAPGKKPLLIAVTVLTSLSDADLTGIGFAGSMDDLAIKLATLSQQAGLDGVVCSAQEAAVMRKTFGKGFCLVTPGIRLATDEAGDQQRIMTPEKAMAAGSDYLVMGRSITQAADPLHTLGHLRI